MLSLFFAVLGIVIWLAMVIALFRLRLNLFEFALLLVAGYLSLAYSVGIS